MTQEELEALYAKEDEDAISEFITAAIGTRQGRAFFWWLLQESGGIGAQPFSGSAPLTDFNCGKLELGNRLTARIIETSPSLFTTLLEQKENERAERRAAIRDAARGGDSPEFDFGDPAAV